MAIRIKQLKSGEYRVYNGSKLATKDEKKQFFRENTDKKLTLSKDDAKLFGAIKGGVKRSETAARSGGEYISGKIQRAMSRMKGLDVNKMLEDMSKQHGKEFKNLNQLFKAVPLAKEPFDRIAQGEGMPTWFNPKHAIDAIKDFDGKVFVNGVEMTKGRAIAKLSEVETTLMRLFDYVGSSVKLNFVGLSELRFDLPDIERVENEKMSEEKFAEEYSEFFQMYSSPKS